MRFARARMYAPIKTERVCAVALEASGVAKDRLQREAAATALVSLAATPARRRSRSLSVGGRPAGSANVATVRARIGLQNLAEHVHGVDDDEAQRIKSARLVAPAERAAADAFN